MGTLHIDNRANGGGQHEIKTFTCNHCHAQIMINPDRTRERGYCRKCDSYLCDPCTTVAAQTRECRPMEQVIDEYLESTVKGSILLGV